MILLRGILGLPVIVTGSSKFTVKLIVSEFDGFTSSSVYTPFVVDVVSEITLGPVRAIVKVILSVPAYALPFKSTPETVAV